jgi:hypothetical protein
MKYLGKYEENEINRHLLALNESILKKFIQKGNL